MSNSFDEAWLQEYRAKMAGRQKPQKTAVVTPSLITFTLSKPTLLLNQLLHMHWTKQRDHKRALSTEIARLLPDGLCRKPFKKASVLVRRMSAGVPDHDNLVGGCKPLMDCLL